MVSMRDSLSFSPTVQNQHNRLIATDGRFKTTPLDHASYQVDLGQLEAAIETLEQGRAKTSRKKYSGRCVLARRPPNEFLRQFWSAIYPPVGETTLGGPTKLAQKTAKATSTAGYLTKTPEKVAAIVRAAEMAGVDRTRVQTDECTPSDTRSD
ncbi:hypothetical protein EDB92DRAFT_1816628 [Lactarius akahatsu]|uniref:Uncharacterized protein n=1 Tax=Lactarius akahatsu TaxID=416441 RepID=A0AAD4LIS5_9AGAM|nr:hypothetical protein EDB92DRAFT_1816628 [Lactarius akahatsu]